MHHPSTSNRFSRFSTRLISLILISAQLLSPIQALARDWADQSKLPKPISTALAQRPNETTARYLERMAQEQPQLFEEVTKSTIQDALSTAMQPDAATARTDIGLEERVAARLHALAQPQHTGQPGDTYVMGLQHLPDPSSSDPAASWQLMARPQGDPKAFDEAFTKMLRLKSAPAATNNAVPFSPFAVGQADLMGHAPSALASSASALSAPITQEQNIVSAAPALQLASPNAVNRTICSSGCSFSSIQAAINAANFGEIFDVQAGTYAEHVVIPSGKNLSLIGPLHSGRAIIDGANNGRTLEIQAGAVAVIENITIQNGRVTGSNGGNGSDAGATGTPGSNGSHGSNGGTGGRGGDAGSGSGGGSGSAAENGGDGLGGGVLNAGTLTLRGVTVVNNSVNGGAGGNGGRGPNSNGNGGTGGTGGDGTCDALFNACGSTDAGNGGNGGGGGPGGSGGRGGDAGNAKGGGIYNTGSLQMESVTVSNNSATGGRGGNGGAGGDGAAGGAGGHGGDVTDCGGSCYGGTGGRGGNGGSGGSGGSGGNGGHGEGAGVYNAGSLNVKNATISHNSMGSNSGGSAGSGGGGGSAGNSGPGGNYSASAGSSGNGGSSGSSGSSGAPASQNGSGGGLFNSGSGTIESSIFANNSADGSPDCLGTITTGGKNLVQNSSGCSVGSGNITGQDPQLGNLQDNRGPVDTHAIPKTSPAFNAGGTCTTIDARGQSRPVGATCDIGAYEYDFDLQISQPAILPVATGSTVSVSVVVKNISLDAANNVIIEDTLPPAFTFSSGTPGCSWVSSKVQCNVGTLAAQSSVTATIYFAVLDEAEGIQTNAFNVSSSFNEADINNNSGTSQIKVTHWNSHIGVPGLNGTVQAVATLGNEIYAGGTFPGYMAHWNNSTHVWETLGALDGDVKVLTVNGSDLYAAGSFTGKIAHWTGSTWQSIGNLDGNVRAILFDGADMYVGGDFTGRVAKWNAGTGAWSQVGSDTPNGTVRALAIVHGKLYAGGQFFTPGNNIAVLDNGLWKPVNDDNNEGVQAGDVFAMGVSGDDLIVAGSFVSPQAGQGGGLAKWDGLRWTAFAGGVTGGANAVYALHIVGSQILIGGSFDNVGVGTFAKNVALWDGAKWRELPESPAVAGNAIYAARIGSPSIVVGGHFDWVADTLPSLNVGRFAWPQRDLAISQQLSANSIEQNQQLSTSLIFTNTGAIVANNVEIKDYLPTDFSYVSDTGGCSFASGAVTCAIGNLNPGESRSIQVTMQSPIDGYGGFTNTVVLYQKQLDKNGLDNIARSGGTLIVNPARQVDLGVSVSALDTANYSDTITYTLNITNGGPGNANNVVVTNTLPSGVVYQTYSAGAATCNYTNATREVICNLGALNSGANATVQIYAQALTNGTLKNKAVVQNNDTTYDLGPLSNTASVTTAVSAPGRQTVNVGNLRVTANQFSTPSPGTTQAMGNIYLGVDGPAGQVNYFYLVEASDSVMFPTGGNTLTGNGTLAYLTSNNDGPALFTGPFTIDGALSDPLIIPDISATYLVTQMGSFALSDTPGDFSLSQANLRTGKTDGSARVHIATRGFDKKALFDFNFKPNALGDKIVLNGSGGDFSLKIAEFLLDVHTPTLDDNGIRSPSVGLKAPIKYGGGLAGINGLSINAKQLLLGKNGEVIRLPDLELGGDEEPKNILFRNGRASVSYIGGKYSLAVNGMLSVTVPDNAQAITTTALIDAFGDFTGTLESMKFKMAGSTLDLKNVTLGSKLISVKSGKLTWPKSLSNTEVLVTDIKITGKGLTIGSAGVGIPVPDMKMGEKLSFVDMKALLIVDGIGSNAHLVFGVKGTMKLNVPDNKQDIKFEARIGVDGQFNGSLDALSLTLAKATLVMRDIKFDNTGLSVKSAKLTLPEKLNKVSGEVKDIRIDGKGLSIGGGAVTIPIPNFAIGGEKGVKVVSSTLTLQIGTDNTYKAIISGTVQITVGTSFASATGFISIDNKGNLGGQVSRFELRVAGVVLLVDRAGFDGDTLTAAELKLAIPPAWGGLSVAVYNLRVGPNGFSIGGGRFQLPDIKLGKINMGGLYGEFRTVSGGYEISAGGFFGIPGMGGGKSCGILVDFTMFAGVSANSAVLKIEPARPDTPDGLDYLKLKYVRAGMRGCKIPIAQTGFALSRVTGSLTLEDNSTRIELGITIESTLELLGVPAVAGDADLGIEFGKRPDYFQVDFEGAITLFGFFKAAELKALVRLNGGDVRGLPSSVFKAELKIRQINPPLYGEASLNAWTIDGSFHLTGRAVLQLGFKKGQLWSGCVNLLIDEICINVPPFDIVFGEIGTEFGEFKKDKGTTWGIKGWVGIHIPVINKDLRVGVYIDKDGGFSIGNVDGYRTVDPPTVARALRAWRLMQAAAKANGASPNIPEADLALLKNYHFSARNNDVFVDFAVPISTDVVIYATRAAAGNAKVSLIRPDGVEITPEHLPGNIGYEEVATTGERNNTPMIQSMFGIKAAEVGTWQVKISGNINPDTDGYLVQVLGIVPPPKLSGLSASLVSADSAVMSWALSVPTTSLSTTLNIWANPGPITETLEVSSTNGTSTTKVFETHGGFPIALDVSNTGVYTADVSRWKSGEYHIWFEADDGRNPPIRKYAPGIIAINRDWPTEFTANLRFEQRYRELDVAWDRAAHPDVNWYRILAAPEPGASYLPDARELDAGDVTSVTLTSLRPDQDYYVRLIGVDADSGRAMQSQDVKVHTQRAPFSLGADASAFVLQGGQQANFVATLSTLMPDFPGVIRLSKGSAPDGIDLLIDQDVLTPTAAGASANVVMQVNKYTRGGMHTVQMLAEGEGQTRKLDLQVQVNEPMFELVAQVGGNGPITSSAGLTVPVSINTDGQTVSVDLSAALFNGADAPVDLMALNMPGALGYALSNQTLAPNAHATLVLTDSELLANGIYTLTLNGSDGVHERNLQLVLVVSKPMFDVAASKKQALAVYGERASYPILVTGQNWPSNVQLSLDPSTIISGVALGFIRQVNDTPTGVIQANVLSGTVALQLVADVAPGADIGLQNIIVIAESNGRQIPINLTLNVLSEAVDADLSLSRIAPDQVIAGQNFVYTMSVENKGPLGAENIILNESGDIAASTFVSASTNVGTWCAFDVGAGTLACPLGTLARDRKAQVVVTRYALANADNSVQLGYSANLTSSTPLGEPFDDESSVSISVRRVADLVASATYIGSNLSPNRAAAPQVNVVVPGSTVVYQAILMNNGPSDATSAVMNLRLPIGVSFVAAKPSKGVCNLKIDVVECVIGNLTAKMAASIRLTGTVQPEARGSLALGIDAFANEADPIHSNSQLETAQAVLAAQANVDISLSASKETPTEGDVIDYVIRVVNNGPSQATGVQISDTLPAGMALAGPALIEPSGFGAAGLPPLLMQGLSLNVGDSLTLTVPVKLLDDSAGQTVINTAQVRWAEMPLPQTVKHSLSIANEAPIANAGDQYTLEMGEQIVLRGSGSDVAGNHDPLDYSWDLNGDGVFGDAHGPSALFDAKAATSVATHTVQLKVSDGDGGETIDTATVSVHVPTRVYADYSLNTAMQGFNPVRLGGIVTTTIVVMNTGEGWITTLPMSSTFDPTYLQLVNAQPPVDELANGELRWNDLTRTWGDLAPESSQTITLTFKTLKDSTALAEQLTLNLANVAQAKVDPDGPNGVQGEILMVQPLTSSTGIKIQSPVAAVISTPRVERVDVTSGVTLSWQTNDESSVVGFDVMRQIGNGSLTKVNTSVIAAKQAGQAAGASYTFVDRTADPKQPYRYVLHMQLVDNSTTAVTLGSIDARTITYMTFIPVVKR